MGIFRSYESMDPGYCTLAIPFDTFLLSDNKAAQCPHHCTTLAGGLNHFQKNSVCMHLLSAFLEIKQIETYARQQ